MEHVTLVSLAWSDIILGNHAYFTNPSDLGHHCNIEHVTLVTLAWSDIILGNHAYFTNPSDLGHHGNMEHCDLCNPGMKWH